MKTRRFSYTLVLLVSAVLLASPCLLGLAIEREELYKYTFTKRSVMYDGAPVYTIDTKLMDENYSGPVLLRGRIIVVRSIGSQILVFRERGKLEKEIKVPRKKPRFFYPNWALISVVVNLGNGVILYNTDGEAFLLNDSFRLKRLTRLNVDTDKYGTGQYMHFSPFTNSVLRIPFSNKREHDYEVTINLQKMEIMYKGPERK